ncbi:haloalkane dehalogenase [mine drainage metagenome]|uniref:Haloalkane dehalogenase n=1 Tax=mine drainage metagenome TaxID=410659 RepID=A0A1J5NX51_9ZZZZ
MRVICPDLIGFGKSDKPKKTALHTGDWHAQIVVELIERLGARDLTLVTADHRTPWVQQVLAGASQSISRLVFRPADAMDRQALEAPFPDAGHCAALRAFVDMKMLPVAAPTWSPST